MTLGKKVGAALDLLGSFIEPKMYERISETLILRVGWWMNPKNGHGITEDDIKQACRLMLAPAKLAELQYGEQKVLGVFAECVEAARAGRARREEQERERKRQQEYAEEPNIRQRAAVLKLLAGVGTQVGRGRPSPPGERPHADEDRPEAEREEAAAPEEETDRG